MPSAYEPVLSNHAIARSICALNTIPTPRPAPTHSAAPAVLNTRKRGQPMRVAPANGGAMVARPGTNFAITSAFTPQRSKRDCVWLTHESGVSDTRHSVFITRLP